MIISLDYDECDPSNLVHIQDCDRNANCTNVISSYTCTCNDGYYGNGSTCAGNSFSKLLFPVNVKINYKGLNLVWLSRKLSKDARAWKLRYDSCHISPIEG